MPNALPVSRLIRVSVNLTPPAAQGQNLSAELILDSSNVIDVQERLREYTGIDGVAADFGTSAAAYKAAALWFEQAPQPTKVLIGKWAKTATSGQLVGGVLSAAQQLISVWTAIVNGGFTVTIDGASAQHLTGLDFSGETNLNGVASVINADLSGSSIAWDSVNGRFVLTSSSTASTSPSTVSFLTAPSSGVDISATLGMTASFSGAYVADGIVAETALEATTIFDQRFAQQWYALVIPEAVNADHLEVAAYIEATTTKHLYGVTTQEAGVLVSNVTSDIAYQLKQLGYKRSVVQYSSNNAYAVSSLFGRILTTDYNGNNTTITLMYKQEPGIAPETLTESQVDALEAKNCNVFVTYNNDTAILEQGKVSSGDFLDVITGTDWLATDIMTEVYNLLYTSPTKVPQTDAGMHLIVTTIEAVCSQGVQNGLLAPGTWQSAGFGALQQNDFLDKGFYVFAPPIRLQQSNDRAARKSVPIQVAAKLAGAVHTVDVSILVNR